MLDDALPAATLVEYLILLPEPGEVLLLSFSSPVDELAEGCSPPCSTPSRPA